MYNVMTFSIYISINHDWLDKLMITANKDIIGTIKYKCVELCGIFEYEISLCVILTLFDKQDWTSPNINYLPFIVLDSSAFVCFVFNADFNS